MKQTFGLMAMIALVGISTAQSAEAFSVKLFEFVGTAEQCACGIAGSAIVGAKWVHSFWMGGQRSQTDANRNALLLSKNGSTSRLLLSRNRL